jgi:hypothetical protein
MVPAPTWYPALSDHSVENMEGLVSSTDCSCNHNMGNKKLFGKQRYEINQLNQATILRNIRRQCTLHESSVARFRHTTEQEYIISWVVNDLKEG